MPLHSTPYNKIRQKSAHNAFQRREGLYDQVVYWRIRSLEIDIHKGKMGRDGVRGDWYVYHHSLDPDTTVDRLSGFLRICYGIGRAIPRHEVITVFLDAKDAFHTTPSAGHSAAALDRLLVEHLGEDRVFTPGDLLARSSGSASLQEAVGQSGWPTLKELRGKILFVLTGDAEKLETYADGNSAAKRMAFLSARVSKPEEAPSDEHHIVFYNLNAKHIKVAKTIYEKGFVSRAYYVNSKPQWNSALSHLCHHIATDKVNERVDLWSRTRQQTGYPFQLLSGGTPSTAEYGKICGLAARSGDLWGVEDSFYFHFRSYDKTPENTYEFLVSGPNSHVDDWTKGGLVARASLDADSPTSASFGLESITRYVCSTA